MFVFLGSHISNANTVSSFWSYNLTFFIACLEAFGSLDVSCKIKFKSNFNLQVSLV